MKTIKSYVNHPLEYFVKEKVHTKLHLSHFNIGRHFLASFQMDCFLTFNFFCIHKANITVHTVYAIFLAILFCVKLRIKSIKL